MGKCHGEQMSSEPMSGHRTYISNNIKIWKIYNPVKVVKDEVLSFKRIQKAINMT